jgi:hypothetical protein
MVVLLDWQHIVVLLDWQHIVVLLDWQHIYGCVAGSATYGCVAGLATYGCVAGMARNLLLDENLDELAVTDFGPQQDCEPHRWVQYVRLYICCCCGLSAALSDSVSRLKVAKAPKPAS